MSNFNSVPAILLLEDGTVYHGMSIGHIGTTSGEICFNTGMTGYQEIFTDPSYFGQLLVTTNAHIGNYGIKDQDIESKSIKIAGLIAKNFTNEFSRKLADASIQDYLSKEKVVGIHQVDTRAIVRHIRSKGAMNAIISSETTDVNELKKQLAEQPKMDGLELASIVSTKEAYSIGDPHAEFRVAVLDFGVKNNILQCFKALECYLKIFPAKTPLSEIKSWKPDGYFLSNGPGDPAPMDYAVELTKQLLEEDAPIFGICLGHQILGLALGLPTYKMHNGHRGINHPVINKTTGKCEITSQNHGFGLDPDAIKASDKVEITHVNLNDETIEGLKVKGKKAFSVQFHPESSPGPHDSRYLFKEFIQQMQISKPSFAEG